MRPFPSLARPIAPAPTSGATTPTEASVTRDTLAFWRSVATNADGDHPSHVVVRVLESILRAVESPR